MKKFSFRLDAVLKLKQKKEDNFKLELAELKRTLEYEKAWLSKLKNDKLKCQNKLLQLRNKLMDINKLILYEKYLEALDRKIVTQTNCVSECKTAIEKKRIELLEASKEKKAVEKLYDKKYSEHLNNARKQEQKLFDEISTVKYGRSANGVG